MTISTANPPVEGLTIKLVRIGVLVALAIIACFVMALDPDQPY